MRKGLIALLLLFSVAVDNPQRAEAGAFATEVTQLLNHAQLVLSYIRQGTQLANELNMYADMLKNSKNLSGHTFGAITADLNALASVVQGGQALAYSLGNLDARFRATYPGYGPTSANYYAQYHNWSQTSLDTTLGVLRAAGLQGQQLSSEQSIISALQGSISGTNGRLEAMQAAGDVAEQQVEQLQKLRELMIADMSSKQAYQATMIQKDAAGEAASQWFFTSGPVTNSGVTYWPGK
jgi:P-type conjugative transfer protein TrbJ